jgi:hypothetical protein
MARRTETEPNLMDTPTARTTSARAILASCQIAIGADFHALTRDQVDNLIAAADRANYRRPANANGSRARYFHAMIQRRAGAEVGR